MVRRCENSAKSGKVSMSASSLLNFTFFGSEISQIKNTPLHRVWFAEVV